MQSYDEAITSASEVIANAMINQLEHVTEHGLNLDDQITDIMRPVAHNVEEMVLQAAHSMLLERYRQQGWKVERHPAVSFKTLHGEVHIKSPYLKKDGEVHGIRPMLLVDQEIPSFNMLPYFHDIVTRTRPWHLLFNFILTYCGLGPIFRFFANRSILHQLQTIQCNPYFAQFPPRLDVSSFAEPASHLSAKVFTENETKSILQACKANNCTVTGALAAAANLAYCELIQDGLKADEDAKIKWHFSIDAKRRFEPKPHEEYLGLFVYMCEEPCMNHVTGSDVDFWKVARETTKEIQDDVKAERYITGETMLRHMMKPKEFFDLLDRELSIRSSVCNTFSSFGSFDFSDDVQHQYYKLHEIFVNCLTHNIPYTFVHFNHTVNGKMYWQITHDVSGVETRHAEEFASLCFGRFIEIARGRV